MALQIGDAQVAPVMEIDQTAPVISRNDILIKSSLETVWRIQTGAKNQSQRGDPSTFGGRGDTRYDDSLTLQILVPLNRFRMPGTAVGDLVTFENIKGVMLPAGRFDAKIFNQVKTPLRNISNAFSMGWATASSG